LNNIQLKELIKHNKKKCTHYNTKDANKARKDISCFYEEFAESFIEISI